VNCRPYQRVLWKTERLPGLAPRFRGIVVVVRPVLELVASFTQILATLATTPCASPHPTHHLTTWKMGS
jgi:hypothetical protein